MKSGKMPKPRSPVARMMMLCGRFKNKVVPDKKKEEARTAARKKIDVDRVRGE